MTSEKAAELLAWYRKNRRHPRYAGMHIAMGVKNLESMLPAWKAMPKGTTILQALQEIANPIPLILRMMQG